MDFTDFTVKDRFAPVFRRDRLLHSYIVIGSDGPVRGAFADTLAAAMICTGEGGIPCGVCRSCKKALRGIHPDIIRISPPEDKNEIPIAAIREVRGEAVIMPNEADGKVFIIDKADFMNAAAQNAFLKTLEEPPKHVRFILLAENPALLLDTVRSRCAELRLRSEDSLSTGDGAKIASELFSAIRGGEIGLAKFAVTLEKLDRASFGSFLESAKVRSVELFRSGELPPEELFRVNSAIDEVAKYLKFNVNPVHVSGLLCARLLAGSDMPLK